MTLRNKLLGRISLVSHPENSLSVTGERRKGGENWTLFPSEGLGWMQTGSQLSALFFAQTGLSVVCPIKLCYPACPSLHGSHKQLEILVFILIDVLARWIWTLLPCLALLSVLRLKFFSYSTRISLPVLSYNKISMFEMIREHRLTKPNFNFIIPLFLVIARVNNNIQIWNRPHTSELLSSTTNCSTWWFEMLS